jgi:hypothetical protein
MKFRHAAALTLVGWYLMIPPIFQNQEPDKDAPLAQWKTIDTYQTGAGCRDELAKLTALVAGNINYSAIQRRTLDAECVSADDPRLKAQ